MKILVTGAAGYLGTVLLPRLLGRGHDVRALDIGYFGLEPLRALRKPVEILRDDVRRAASDPAFLDRVLDGCGFVVHLAAISNDPSAELHPDLTYEVNRDATVALARGAKARGIGFLFSSSCSVYGEAPGELDEDGAVAPLTTYAISKVQAERELLAMADTSWRPVILRNGTLYGLSPRMRFDLVVNIFAMHAAMHGRIRVFGDGLQWRPFLHVKDCARAMAHLAEAPAPRFTTYNVSGGNLRVVDLAEEVGRIAPGTKVEHSEVQDPDKRDYRVTAKRLAAEGFSPRYGVAAGLEEMMDAIVGGTLADPESIFYRNAKWLKELSAFGGKDHAGVVGLLQLMSQRPGGPRS